MSCCVSNRDVVAEDAWAHLLPVDTHIASTGRHVARDTSATLWSQPH